MMLLHCPMRRSTRLPLFRGICQARLLFVPVSMRSGMKVAGGGGLLLQKEGLYRIVDTDNERSFQVIVYKQDIWELFRSLCKIFYRGDDDNNLRLYEWTQRAVFRNVLMSCGFVAISCCKLFETLGIKSRVVGLAKNGSLLHGHNINEIFIDGRWILVDFSKKIVVQDKEGNLPSLRNVIDKGGFGQYVLQPICNEPVGSGSLNCALFVSRNGYFCNYGFRAAFASLSYPKNLKAWFDAYDVYLCSENPVYEQYILKGDDDYNRKLKERYPEGNFFSYLSYQDFMNKFYGEN